MFEGEASDVAVSGYFVRHAGHAFEWRRRATTFYTSKKAVRPADSDDWLDLPFPDHTGAAPFRDQVLVSLREDWELQGQTLKGGSMVCLLCCRSGSPWRPAEGGPRLQGASRLKDVRSNGRVMDGGWYCVDGADGTNGGCTAMNGGCTNRRRLYCSQWWLYCKRWRLYCDQQRLYCNRWRLYKRAAVVLQPDGAEHVKLIDGWLCAVAQEMWLWFAVENSSGQPEL